MDYINDFEGCVNQKTGKSYAPSYIETYLKAKLEERITAGERLDLWG